MSSHKEIARQAVIKRHAGFVPANVANTWLERGARFATLILAMRNVIEKRKQKGPLSKDAAAAGQNINASEN